MYARSRAWIPSATAVLSLVCLVACTPSTNEPGIPTATPSISAAPTTPIPQTSPSPKPLSAKQKAEQEVLALTTKYYEIDKAIATDEDVPLNRYYEVTSGDYAQTLLKAAQMRRSKGYTVSGQIKRTAPEIKNLQLRVSSDRLPSATTQVCLDVHEVKVVDKHGKSVVQPGRADAYIEKLTLEKKDYGWRVVDGEDQEAKRCDE